MRRCYVGEYKYAQDFIELTHCPQFNIRLMYAHPSEFRDIVNSIDYAIWTNNPYIVDHFQPEEVYVCSAKGIKRITEHNGYNDWKNEFTLGEMWSMFGEDW